MTVSKSSAIVSLLIAAIGWAMAGVFIKMLSFFSSFEIVSLRFLMALFFLHIFLWFSKKLPLVFQDFKHPITWLYSFIMLLCYYFGTIAFLYAPVGETTLFMTVAPLFVVFYKVLKKEIVSQNEKIGFGVVIIGIGLFFGFNSFDTIYTGTHFMGNILALLVAFLFALYSILHFSYKSYSPSTFGVTYGMFLFALLPSLYTISEVVVFKGFLEITQHLWVIVAIGIFSTAIPTIAITVASKVLPPIMTSSVLLLETIFGVIFAFLFLDEAPSLYFVFSFFVVLVGIWMMLRKK